MISYFIRKSIVTLCLNFAIIFLGLFSMKDIANEFIPAIDIPAVAVVFPTTVLTKEQVLRDVVEHVEQKLMSTGIVDHIETRLESGKVVLVIFYSWKYKPEECLQHARQIVTGIVKTPGVLDPIFVLHRPTMSPILRVVLHSEMPIGRLTEISQKLATEIERTPGVSQVRLDGATPKVGLVNLDMKKSTARHVSVLDLIESARQRWSFRHLMNNESNSMMRMNLNAVEDIKDLLVMSAAGKSVPLHWIADVKTGTLDPTVYFGKGQPALILEVIKSPGADAVSIVDQALGKVNKLTSDNSMIKNVVIYDEASKIKEAQDGVLSNFASGIVLNSIILIFFLGSISGCAIASCVFPTAIFGTLSVMKWMGISFNIFSLNGFSLAAGMITDSSTVVLESILSRKQKGEELESSCENGTKDVGTGVFTGALTSSAVLLPICLQTGVSSKLFSDLAITLITGNFLCLIGVFTLVPWLTAKITPEKERKKIAPVALLFRISSKLVKKVSSFSGLMFDRSLKNKRYSVFLPAVVSVLSFATLFFMPPSELLPMVKSNTYAVTVPIPRHRLDQEGSGLQSKMTEVFGENDAVDWAITTRDEDMIKATVHLKPQNKIDSSIIKLSETLSLPVKRVLSFPLGPTPPTEPMNYSGYFYLDSSIEPGLRASLREKFCTSVGVMDCNGREQYAYTGITLQSLPLNMGRSGLNPLDGALEGSARLSQIDLNGIGNLPFTKPVYLKLDRDTMITDDPLLTHKSVQKTVGFGSFYDRQYKSDSSVMLRYDLNTYEPLYFRLGGVTIGEALKNMDKAAEELNILPSKVLGMGAIQNMKETFGKMSLALTIAGILNFLILLWQFKSVIQTSIIMFSIPLAVGGAILGLILMGETLNAGVIVGFVLLVGIVVNNGILLMEAMNQALDGGMELVDAIKVAVSSRTRPILMTAFGTIFGMLPTLLFESEGAELYRGMAIVNIFGMAFGSFLTLVVTPILTRNFLSWQMMKQMERSKV